jgi:hypothetical protein
MPPTLTPQEQVTALSALTRANLMSLYMASLNLNGAGSQLTHSIYNALSAIGMVTEQLGLEFETVGPTVNVTTNGDIKTELQVIQGAWTPGAFDAITFQASFNQRWGHHGLIGSAMYDFESNIIKSVNLAN